MNQKQKLVQQQFLNNEKKIINRLDQVYGQSLKDINDKIKNLTFQIGNLQQMYDWMDDTDPQKEKVKSMIQSKIYQKQYQEQLQSQVDGILKQMQTKSYTTVAEYLNECYEDGFIGTIFDAHGQGVPIMTPINQESMVRAVQLESKIKQDLYTKLGEDVGLLKKKIMAQVSRSIATGMTYAQTAKALEGYTRIGYNNAVRIARTEGHRIQCTAAMDAMHSAKDKGADVVKQWDATLDDRTRESHSQVDGEIRELDEAFSNDLDFPGDPSGGAAEVVNCRCALLQRARWALDADELKTLQDRAKYFGLDKTTEFEDFKKKYLAATEPKKTTKNTVGKPSNFTPAKDMNEATKYAKKFSDNVSFSGVTNLDAVNEINERLTYLTETYPIDKLNNMYANSRLKRAGMRACYDVLEFNPDTLNKNSMKYDWEARIQQNREKIEEWKKYTDPKIYPPSTVKAYKKAIKEAEKENMFKRWTFDSDTGKIADTVTHEYGHILADQYFGQINTIRANIHFSHNVNNALYQTTLKVNDAFQKAKKNGDIYNLSMYASTDQHEFFAETFSMYVGGEKLPDYIEEMLKEVLKNGRL